MGDKRLDEYRARGMRRGMEGLSLRNLKTLTATLAEHPQAAVRGKPAQGRK